MFVSLHLL
uniref:Uncharacterized protein n=1 Tax=Anguilla anguilla TaxID=7936 RepID=A0A0E9TAM6_ANGAN